MKKTLATAALALTGLLAVPTNANAGLEVRIGSSHTFANGRASCGCTTYLKKIFVGRDACGRALFRYIRVPVVHRCSHRSIDHRPRDRMYSRFSTWRNRHHQERGVTRRHSSHSSRGCSDGQCRR